MPWEIGNSGSTFFPGFEEIDCFSSMDQIGGVFPIIVFVMVQLMVLVENLKMKDLRISLLMEPPGTHVRAWQQLWVTQSRCFPES